MFVLAIGLRGS